MKRTVFNTSALELKEHPWQKFLGPIVATEWQLNVPGHDCEVGEVPPSSSVGQIRTAVLSLNAK